jgi:hypothetical protein
MNANKREYAEFFIRVHSRFTNLEWKKIVLQNGNRE